MKYDVCILSRDKMYSQWLLLLLTERGKSVALSDSHLTSPASRVYITDLDSARPASKESVREICFSQDKELISHHGGLLRPFSPDELFEALDGVAEASIGEAITDDGERTISFCGRYIRLTSREYELFTVLRQANGASVSREEICRKIWGCDETESLNIYIHYLRKKLECNGVKVIKSHRGKGYSLLTRGI